MKNKSHHNLTDYEPYQADNVPLFETIYGKNLISLGGFAAIENMFSDLKIEGLKALDLGFGLGGVAFYLAQKYRMKITGIELHPWMVQYANKQIPSELQAHLEFTNYNQAGEFPYNSETFDLVYSKGVLNHIADKASLFKQVNSVLKPNGVFVIADWIFPKATVEHSAPLVCETEESYEKVLIDAGFSEVKFRDDSQLFLCYIKELLINLSNHQEFIIQQYGEKIFLAIQEQHEELIKKIKSKQKIATRIIATKSDVYHRI